MLIMPFKGSAYAYSGSDNNSELKSLKKIKKPLYKLRKIVYSLNIKIEFNGVGKDAMIIMVFVPTFLKGRDGDSVSKNPTERRGHRLRAVSGGSGTIGNTPEPDD
ncbi:hypothetical protein [Clostridium sp.]